MSNGAQPKPVSKKVSIFVDGREQSTQISFYGRISTQENNQPITIDQKTMVFDPKKFHTATILLGHTDDDGISTSNSRNFHKP